MGMLDPQSKPKKGGYRKRMHGIWKQDGMKEVGNSNYVTSGDR